MPRQSRPRGTRLAAGRAGSLTRALLALGLASLLLGLPAAARRPRPPATREVQETATCRVVVKTQQVTLPADAYEGKRIQYQESSRRLVRRVFTDASPRDGRFVRTITTTTTTLKGDSPAPWQRRPDDLTPPWSPEEAPYLYTSKRLGTIYKEDPRDPSRGSVQVRLFAPRARQVSLVIEETGERVRLAPDRSGLWEARLDRPPARLYGKRYHFEVDGQAISNPYCHLTDGDYGPSRFARLPDLEQPRRPKGEVLQRLQQRGVAEIHVKDMTAHPSAPVSSPAERGTYLGLRSARVLQHYDDLGVGGLEALPISQFDRESGDRQNGRPTRNHWGYMTTHYASVHQGWAARPEQAHLELREAVAALKARGKSVILDVAFNHTATGPALHLQMLGRDYYYRLRPDGSLADGAGCGNELATEKPMVRRMIVQTLRDFVTKFGVDGFRLDLGSLIDKQTIRAIDRALPKHVFVTAEPWAADWTRSRWGKGDLGGSLRDTRITAWNDDFRNAAWSFLGGDGGGETRNQLMNAVCGSVRDFGRGWAARPTQAVNYLESHDELTLADRVRGDKRRAFLGQVLLLTSQGIPMLGHGQEMLRSKQGIANAHNLDNEVSWLDWRLKGQHQDFLQATEKLIALRASSPHFHYQKRLTERDISWLTPANPNALGYLVRPPAGTPGRRNMPDYLVLLNSDPRHQVTFDLPRGGEWKVVVDGASLQVDPAGLRTASGTYRVDPGTAVILSQPRPPSSPAARR